MADQSNSQNQSPTNPSTKPILNTNTRGFTQKDSDMSNQQREMNQGGKKEVPKATVHAQNNQKASSESDLASREKKQ